MEDKALRDYLEDKIVNLIEKSNSMEPGTEQHSKIVEDIDKLCKAYENDYKVEWEVYNQNLKTEYDNKRSEEEMKVKKLQVYVDKRKHDRIKADNVFTMAGLAVLTAGTCLYEVKGGHINEKDI